MTGLFYIRAFAYLALPLLLAGLATAVDRRARTREHRLELFLIFMFAFGAASGIAGALGHLFASDLVAESIGWPPGSPFQLEMGFANLAGGVLAAIAVSRRDGFREATVLSGAIVSVGAFTVHMIDIIQHGNLSPGNTLINITNLGRPAILIFLLWAQRRAGRSLDSESNSDAFSQWRSPWAALGGTLGAGVGMGLGIGMAVERPLLGLTVGLVGSIVLSLVQGNRPYAT